MTSRWSQEPGRHGPLHAPDASPAGIEQADDRNAEVERQFLTVEPLLRDRGVR